MPNFTLGLYPLEQIPGVSAGSVLAGEAFNTGGTITFQTLGHQSQLQMTTNTQKILQIRPLLRLETMRYSPMISP